MKRNLFHWKYGFIGAFTLEEANDVMNELGGCFKWDNPFTVEDFIL